MTVEILEQVGLETLQDKAPRARVAVPELPRIHVRRSLR